MPEPRPTTMVQSERDSRAPSHARRYTLAPPDPFGWRGNSGQREAGLKLMSRLKVALMLVFVIVFALWLAWGYQLTRSLEQTELNLAEAHAIHVRGEQTLLKLRTGVLLGSIYLRDAIIDTATPQREYYRSELSRLRAESDDALRSYLPDVASETEREHWLRLESELAEFWASRNIPFTQDDDSRDAVESAALLRQRVVPRRTTILEIIDQLASLQAAANLRRQAEINDLHVQVRRRLLSMGAVTLALAILASVVASFYVSGLQRQIERQRMAEKQTREDLERLSARLVDAQEQERRHLARELHDAVGQALTAVKMDIGIALRSGDPARVRNALAEASELTESTLRSVRDLSRLLHPSVLDDFGLPATLAAFLRDFSRRTGIKSNLVETIEERLPAEIEAGAYRIVQEALNNVSRHSSASSCTVSLNIGDGALHLVIDDNGRGLDNPADQSMRRGLGLIGMRERAQVLGGSLRIESPPGGGVRLSVTLPLARSARRDVPALEPQTTT